MKKKFYAKPAKLLVLILTLAAAAVMGLSGGLCTYTGISFGEINPAAAESYYQSEDLAASLYGKASDFVANMKESQTYFTSSGKVRRNNTIDLRDIASDHDYTIEGETSSDRKYLEYKIGDLLDFYHSDGYTVLKWLIKDGNYQQFITGGEADSADTTSKFGLIYGKKAVSDGTLTKTFSHRDGSGKFTVKFKTYPDYAYSVLYNNGIRIEKEYHLQSSAGITLAEYAAKNTSDAYSDISILDCYQTLCTAAKEVHQTVKAGAYEPSVSNAMVYIYNLGTGNVYTNVKRWRTMSFSSVRDDYFKRYNRQSVAWSDQTAKTQSNLYCSANMQGAADSLADDASYNLSPKGKYLVLLGFNTSMPETDDTMAKDLAASVWMTSLPFPARHALPICIIAMAVLAFLTICGGLQAGRRDTDQEIHFRKIDRIPLELMLLMDVVIWIVFLLAGLSLLSGMNFATDIGLSGISNRQANLNIQSEAAWVCILGFCSCAVGGLLLTWTVRRWARRVKGKNPGGSLVVKGLKNLGVRSKTFYENRKENGKLVIRYTLFIIVNVILGGLAIRGIGYGYSRSLMLRTGICGALWLIVVIYMLYRLLMMAKGREEIKRGIEEISSGNLDSPINTDGMSPYNKEIAEGLSHVKEGLKAAVESEMKHERLKTDLITNVSHDIKTPLTSIINYVDILKRKDIQDPEIREYIDVLDRKSARLKQLVEDLVESSKISSGNITLDMQKIDLGQLILQENGEYQEKFESRNLQLVCSVPEEPMHIFADGRRMYRVIDNLYNNAAKYSMPGTRIYADGRMEDGRVIFTVKNISESPLNISADELMERFVRGDVSRSTEGSGLGLEIARNLTALQKGTFDIRLDGDLFKVTITFAAI